MSGRLEGKVCVITGAGSGIGRAIAEALAAEAAVVATIDLEGDSDQPDVIAADVSDAGSAEGVVSEVVSRHGGIDALVNCAGIWAPGTVSSTETGTWERVFAVNVTGTYLMSRFTIPYMEANGGGSIVNIASNNALVGGRNAAAYTASKGAVLALTRAMALDHAPAGIRVNCICPGTVDTPMIREPMRSMTDDEVEEVTASRLQRHPIGRIGRPEDIAPGVVYLLSDESSFVTGVVLPIDGGYTAQ